MPRSLDFLLDAVDELRRFFLRDKLPTSVVRFFAVFGGMAYGFAVVAPSVPQSQRDCSGCKTGIFRLPYSQGFHAKFYMRHAYTSEFFVSFVCFCSLFSVGPRQNHAYDTIAQLHFMEVDDQPKRDIQEFHIA